MFCYTFFSHCVSEIFVSQKKTRFPPCRALPFPLLITTKLAHFIKFHARATKQGTPSTGPDETSNLHEGNRDAGRDRVQFNCFSLCFLLLLFVSSAFWYFAHYFCVFDGARCVNLFLSPNWFKFEAGQARAINAKVIQRCGAPPKKIYIFRLPLFDSIEQTPSAGWL